MWFVPDSAARGVTAEQQLDVCRDAFKVGPVCVSSFCHPAPVCCVLCDQTGCFLLQGGASQPRGEVNIFRNKGSDIVRSVCLFFPLKNSCQFMLWWLRKGADG